MPPKVRALSPSADPVMLSSCFPMTFHTQSVINDIIKQIRELDGETKVCMEYTGRYYEPVATWLSDAGIFVSAVNPIPEQMTSLAVPHAATAARSGRISSTLIGMWTVCAVSHRMPLPSIYHSSSDLLAVFPKDDGFLFICYDIFTV